MRRVRPLARGDAEILAVLHGACFADEQWSATALREVLAMPGAFGYLAVAADGAPAGFLVALALPGECEILALGVDPPARRRGCATRLLDNLLADAADRAILLEVAEDNAAARALYSGRGFVEVGRRPAYYKRRGGEPVAALQLRRPNSR
jgi:ribosomal-protein-alanine N-acetyltransferase